MSRKDADQLVGDLRDHFKEAESDYQVEKRGGHWHVVNANGKSIARFASTPSIDRFRRNTVADLRRRGILPDTFR